MCDRINHLYNTFQAMPREAVRRKLEAWFADQGCARSNLLLFTIRNEATCGIFLNIRLQLNPMDHSGLQYVNIPRDTPDSPVTPYAYLQSPPSDIIWEKVIDWEAIDAQILKYIQKRFCAAVVSPTDASWSYT